MDRTLQQDVGNNKHKRDPWKYQAYLAQKLPCAAVAQAGLDASPHSAASPRLPLQLIIESGADDVHTRVEVSEGLTPGIQCLQFCSDSWFELLS